MSTTMKAYCPIHEEEGPRIHRNAGGAAALWPNQGEDIFDKVQAMAQWSRWLIVHEFCDFVMRR